MKPTATDDPYVQDKLHENVLFFEYPLFNRKKIQPKTNTNYSPDSVELSGHRKTWNLVQANLGTNVLKRDSLQTIDKAMEIQQILFEFADVINSYFKFQLLVVILTAFIVIVFDCYYLLEVLNNPAKRKYII